MRKKSQVIPKTKFVTNIKTIRRVSNLKIFDLAQNLGITERQIQLWQIGKSVPSMLSAIRIAHYFNLTLDELFFSKISPFRISGRFRKQK